ncbi:hypothetical protein HPP92_014457 [Vanilla planifolia]|uniref:Protein TILLER ANGLE CONTROL 1 n=1 Tax=Vanilla planifolia TaxID=51239 RepID=A0A835UU33_VANPL|nr:hypothetical protein HPP92_014457 [Vanilla planifolia]
MALKLFDWMNRKLRPSTEYSRFSHKKAPGIKDDGVELAVDVKEETKKTTEEPLLHHVAYDGFLAIGTLGHFHPFFLSHIPEESNPHDQELLAPPTGAVSAAPLYQQLQRAPEMFSKAECSVFAEALLQHEEKATAELPLLVKEDGERKERTTLADLLAAEPASEKCTSTVKSSNVVCKEKGVPKNKLKKEDDDGTSPQSPAAAKRLHRMITRMMTKKIHPEASAPPRKGGGGPSAGMEPLLTGDSPTLG